jgi:hypothetical protein
MIGNQLITIRQSTKHQPFKEDLTVSVVAVGKEVALGVPVGVGCALSNGSSGGLSFLITHMYHCVKEERDRRGRIRI